MKHKLAMQRSRFFAVLCVLAVASVVVDSSCSKKNKTEFEKRAELLDRYLAALVPFGFSGGVLWSRGDHVFLQKGYGQADRSHNIAMTSAAVFPLESVSKQFTAAAILSLEAAGKLSVTDSISKFIPNVPPDKSSITLHQLLSHTSGVIAGTEEYFEDNSKAGVLQVALGRPLLFPPGTNDEYSNIGYVLLAAVVESVSGMPFDEYVSQALFVPAGLEHTGYRPVAGEAIAHRYLKGVDKGVPTNLNRDWNVVGAAGLLSTTGDLLQWHQALMGTDVLPDSSKQKMYTPVANDYGYGWEISETDSGTVVEHTGGSSEGTAMDYVRNLDKNEVMVLFANSDGEETLFRTQLRDNVRAIIRGEVIAVAPAVASPQEKIDLTQFAGDYGPADSATVHVEVVDQTLDIFGTGQAAVFGLLSIAGEERERYVAVNSRAAQVLSGIVSKDYRSLVEHSSEKMGPRLETTFKSVSDSKGISGFSILGTVPPIGVEGADFMTIFALHSERDSTVFRFYWDAGKISALGGSGIKQPVRIRARVAANQAIIGYHVPSGRSVELKYTADASGRVKRLTSATGGLDVSRVR